MADVAGRLPPQLRIVGHHISVVLGVPTECVVEFDPLGGEVTLDVDAFLPLLEHRGLEGVTVAEAVLATAWARFTRHADGHLDGHFRVAGAPDRRSDRCDAEDLEQLFGAAFPFLEEAHAFLSRETDLGVYAAGELTLSADLATIDVLCGDSEWRSQRAERLLIDRGDLRLLPALADAYEHAVTDVARERVTRVYRAVGSSAYYVWPARAVRPVRRASAGKRLVSVDTVIRDLLAVTHSRRVPAWLDVETAAFADALADGAVIVDEGASDATTSFDLASSILEDPRLRAIPIQVFAADIANRFFVWRNMVFDAKGLPLQRKQGEGIWSYKEFEATISAAHELQGGFAALPEHERRACEHVWVNPTAVAFARRHPDRLGWLTRDLFEPLPQPVSLIRAFNVLYRRLHLQADAASYFEPAEILNGLRSIGRNLRPGGVAMVGSIIDHAARPRWFIDYEIWQRTGSVRAPRLLLRTKQGRGLGVSAWRIELGH